MTALDRTPSLFASGHPVAVEAITRKEANRLLETWEHPLGACNRPFGQDHFALIAGGAPVACAVSASMVSPTIRDENETTWPRDSVLELARIARPHSAPWSLRVMLRLWREALVDEWPHWDPGLLVSYAMPGTPGDLYRFDGWTRVRVVGPSKPSEANWSNTPKVNAIADGRKTLWVYHRKEPV